MTTITPRSGRGIAQARMGRSSARRRNGRSRAMLREKQLSNPWKKHDNIPL